MYRSPATGLLCHIPPVNLPACQLSLSLSSPPDKYSFYWGIFHFSLSLSLQLVPLIGFISVGLGSAVLYLLRLALYSPDVRYALRCPGTPGAPLGLAPHPQSLGGSAQLWWNAQTQLHGEQWGENVGLEVAGGKLGGWIPSPWFGAVGEGPPQPR